MVLTLLPSVALAAESGSNSESSTVKNVTYLDADGVEQTVAAAAAPTDVNEGGMIHTWGNSGKTSWYYVDGTAKIDSYLTVIGNVNLILCDGANLTVDRGIRIDRNKRLTIYAQSSGENAGKLTAKGSMLSSGGDSGISGDGALTINGGVIEATCNDAFEPFARSCGITVDTTINGGKVTAGGGASNGYGGKSYGVFGSLTFNGGTLIAKSSTARGTAQALCAEKGTDREGAGYRPYAVCRQRPHQQLRRHGGALGGGDRSAAGRGREA